MNPASQPPLPLECPSGTYRMALGSLGGHYVAAFFCLVILWGLGSILWASHGNGDSLSTWGLVVVVLTVIGFTTILFFIGRDIWRNRVVRWELDPKGIKGWDGQGGTASLEWKRMVSIEDLAWKQQVRLMDASGGKGVTVDYRTVDLSRILPWVLEKCLDNLSVPALPLRYGLPIRLNWYFLGFAGIWPIFFAALICFASNPPRGAEMLLPLLVVGFFFIPFFWVLQVQRRTFRALEINEEGVTLHRKIGKVFLAWGDFGFVLERLAFLEITFWDGKGNSYALKLPFKVKLEAFLALAMVRHSKGIQFPPFPGE